MFWLSFEWEADNDHMYASEENELYASADTICFHTCTRSMHYPVDYLQHLAAADYDEDSEPASFQEAYDFWVLRECLLTIGRHTPASPWRMFGSTPCSLEKVPTKGVILSVLCYLPMTPAIPYCDMYVPFPSPSLLFASPRLYAVLPSHSRVARHSPDADV
ncbi:hypothetical protein B0H19DRAFT_1252644 [Mycena capillaripes]|nr:hypothetical protein B0H19DRAFT_1252644 [Mycena capillaripes]